MLSDTVIDEATIARLGTATFLTTGQLCMTLKRLYVPRSLDSDVVDGLRGFVDSQRIGAGLNPSDPLTTSTR